MALEQKLHLKLAQKLVMTPTLQQAIKLLQLSRLELEQTLAQEVQINPVLELVEEVPAEDEAGATPEPADEELAADEAAGREAARSDDDEALAGLAPAPAGAERVEEGAAAGPDDGAGPTGDSYGEVELDALFTNYLHDSPAAAPTWDDGEDSPLENSPTPIESLYDSLRAQLGLLDVPGELQSVCEFVVGNLDPDGYLRLADEEISGQLGVPVARVQEAVAWVQRLDPPGIGARDLRECFLLQLDRLDRDADGASLELTRRIVSDGLDDLLHQRWERLVQAFDIPREALRGVLDLIRHLDPRPGVALGPNDNTVVEPDVVASRTPDGWRISLNDDGLPRLRLSQRYLRLLKSRGLDGETTGYLRERMRAALWFLRSVEQRQNTIVRVAEAIVRRQQEFLDKGLTHLRPLVLRDIADDIGMHESTVSRVVANKYIATPRGVFALKFFFHSSISHAVQGDISSVVVKERIKELIAGEDSRRPLSDARVARQLNRLGIRIARRTVAKYREELGIPSSEQRRKSFR